MELDLKQLRQLAEKATPGQWFMPMDDENFVAKDDGKGGWDLICQPEQVGDMEFIASANPAVVLELIRRVERAALELRNDRSGNESLKAALAILEGR